MALLMRFVAYRDVVPLLEGSVSGQVNPDENLETVRSQRCRHGKGFRNPRGVTYDTDERVPL